MIWHISYTIYPLPTIPNMCKSVVCIAVRMDFECGTVAYMHQLFALISILSQNFILTSSPATKNPSHEYLEQRRNSFRQHFPSFSCSHTHTFHIALSHFSTFCHFGSIVHIHIYVLPFSSNISMRAIQ